MPGIHELEILHIDEGTGKPVAFSYDPESLSTEAVKTILNNQINSSKPVEVHCYVRGAFKIGGVFKTIEAEDFDKAKVYNERQRVIFINKSLSLIKGPETFNIIFSEPLKDK